MASFLALPPPARLLSARSAASESRRKCRAAAGLVAAAATTTSDSAVSPPREGNAARGESEARRKRALERLWNTPAAAAPPPAQLVAKSAPPVVRRSPVRGVVAARRRRAPSPETGPRVAEQLARRRTGSLDAERLVRSRVASQSRAAERSGRFGAGAPKGHAVEGLRPEEQVHLSRQLRRGQAAEAVRQRLGDAASDAEWAFACGLQSAAALQEVLSQAASARSLLLTRNVGLVKTVARRFASSLGNVRGDDLVVDGLLGLVTATELYDPERGTRFSTFAFARVEAAQRRAIQNGRALVRTPVWLQDVQQKLQKARAALATDGVLEPTDEELALAANTPLAHVHAVTDAFTRHEVSFDGITLEEPDSMSATEQNKRWLDAGADVSPEAEVDDDADPWMRASVEQRVRVLGDEQRRAVRSFYGLDDGIPKTPGRLAKRLGLKPHAVSALVRRGLAQLSAAA